MNAEWIEQSDSCLLKEHWYRIVCDESHIMKNYKTKTWIAARCLKAGKNYIIYYI